MPPAPPHDRAELLALYSQHVRQAPWLPPPHRVERVPPVVRLLGPGPHHLDNGVCWAQLSAQDAGAIVRREIEHFSALGRDFQWNVYGYDTPCDLDERLIDAGFRLQGRETIVVADAAEQAPPRALPVGVTLERVVAPAQVDDLLQVQDEVWGTRLSAWLRASLLRDLGSLGTHATFLVRVGQEPAAGAWVVTPPGSPFAHLFGGTVGGRHRGRGLYRALLAARAQAARAAGARWLVADANENSRPVLERAGFAALTTRTELAYGTDLPAPAAPV
jgi:hypothetical protein